MVNVPESHQDLLNVAVGVLATNGPDGYPQASAIWFIHDDDGFIKFYLTNTRQKVKNLLARDEASFLILEPPNGYKTVELRGRVEITPDPDYAFVPKMVAKYGPVDFKAMDAHTGGSRVVVTLHPEKVNIWGK